MKNKYTYMATLTAAVLGFSQLSSAETESLSQVVEHLMVVSNHCTPTEASSRVSEAAVTLYKEGKTTAPIAMIAVSNLLGEKNPAMAATITGLVKAGANPSLMVVAGQRAGVQQQEVFVAMLEGGVDPTTLTSSTAAGGHRTVK